MIVVVAGLLLVGCRGGSHVGTAASKPISSTPPTRWTATQDPWTGGDDARDARLTTVSAIAVGPDGDIYVGQPRPGYIQVFDSAGRPVRTIGQPDPRRPGELRGVQTVGFVGDTVYAYIMASRVVALLSTRGEVLGTLSQGPKGLTGELLHPLPPFQLCPDGSGIATPAVFVATAETALPRVPYFRVKRDGTILDTLAFRTRAHASMIVRGRGSVVVGQPFSDGALVAVSPDGRRVAVVDRTVAAHSDSATFRVTVLRSTRDTVYSRTYTYAPVPMKKAWGDSAIAGFARRVRPIFTSDSAALAGVRKAMFIPSYARPVSQALYSEDGTLWIERERVPGRRQTLVALDSLGAPVAGVDVPSGVDIKLIRNDEMLGAMTDSLGVTHLVRYRIER